MVHAKLGIAEENSGKLVTLLKKKAKNIAEEKNLSYILIDGSPGIGCPVISSIGNASLVVIIVEPTVSGIHDMDRVIKLIHHFKIPGGIVINKSDLNIEMSENIETIVKQNKLYLFGKISYNPVVTKAMVEVKTITEYSNNHIVKEIQSIYRKIREVVDI
jgi:MinD superfamily P-loop ATPase